MKELVDITLIEHSTTGNPDKPFAQQQIEITRGRDEKRGRVIVAPGVAEVAWFGGKAADFDHITHVKIVRTPDKKPPVIESELITEL